MFPPKCIQPACRNIATTIETGMRRCRTAAPQPLRNRTISPQEAVGSAGGSDSSKKKPTFAAIRSQLIHGVVRVTVSRRDQAGALGLGIDAFLQFQPGDFTAREAGS
jgi:hypothetical protein